MDTLGLLPRRLPIVVTGRAARRRAVGVVAGDGDREAVCLDLDGYAAEAVGKAEREQIVDQAEQRVVLAHWRSTRRHHGCGGGSVTPAPGSRTVPNERKRS